MQQSRQTEEISSSTVKGNWTATTILINTLSHITSSKEKSKILNHDWAERKTGNGNYNVCACVLAYCLLYEALFPLRTATLWRWRSFSGLMTLRRYSVRGSLHLIGSPRPIGSRWRVRQSSSPLTPMTLARITVPCPEGYLGEGACWPAPGGQVFAHGAQPGSAQKRDISPSYSVPTTHRRVHRGLVQYGLSGS